MDGGYGLDVKRGARSCEVGDLSSLAADAAGDTEDGEVTRMMRI